MTFARGMGRTKRGTCFVLSPESFSSFSSLTSVLGRIRMANTRRTFAASSSSTSLRSSSSSGPKTSSSSGTFSARSALAASLPTMNPNPVAFSSRSIIRSKTDRGRRGRYLATSWRVVRRE